MSKLNKAEVEEKEAALGREIQLEATRHGARIFRNNVGMGWAGNAVFEAKGIQEITVYPGDVIVRGARPIRYGLRKGSSDYIGYRTVIISPEMVGKHFAIFVSAEIKKPRGSKEEQDQKDWIEAVKAAGGLAAFVRSVDEVKPFLDSH